MHLTCPECGAPVEVTSSFTTCPACDANIASHYSQAEMTRTVYHRALEHYSMGNDQAALDGIQQGITLLEAPELHLLAALIYRKRGEFKEMREHVSAIPDDDVLRGEGEWLLRSHQEQLQQGRLEEARRRSKGKSVKGAAASPRERGTQLAVGKANQQFSDEYYPAPLEKRRNIAKSAPGRRRSRLPWAIPIAAAVLVLIFLAQGAGDTLLSSLRQLRSIPDGLTSVYSSFTADEGKAAPQTGAQSSPVQSEASPAQQRTAAATSTPLSAAQPPAPTLAPTVQATAAAATSESSSPDVAATIIAAARVQTFDLTTFLNGQDRADLAGLGVQASWASGAPPGELILQGTVSMAAVKAELVDLASTIEGVTAVISDGIALDLPDTYLVRVGENLRHIAYRLYGDPDRWTAIYEANKDLIGEDPNNLWVGLSLTIPQEQATQEEQETALEQG